MISKNIKSYPLTRVNRTVFKLTQVTLQNSNKKKYMWIGLLHRFNCLRMILDRSHSQKKVACLSFSCGDKNWILPSGAHPSEVLK